MPTPKISSAFWRLAATACPKTCLPPSSPAALCWRRPLYGSCKAASANVHRKAADPQSVRTGAWREAGRQEGGEQNRGGVKQKGIVTGVERTANQVKEGAC